MIRRAKVEHAKNQIWCSDVSLVNARKKSAKPRKKKDSKYHWIMHFFSWVIHFFSWVKSTFFPGLSTFFPGLSTFFPGFGAYFFLG